jgi:quinol monooxygenase YgiN
MHARSTTIKADPDNLDAGIAFTRDEVMPAIQQIDGCIGLSMLTDRESGRCIVTTSWADADAMRAATEDVHPIRLMQALGAQGLDIQEWEIAVLHRERPAGDGAGAQVTWARIAPNHLDDLLAAYRLNLLPKLQELPGFCSVSMLVDRRLGRTVSVTSFENRDAAGLVRKHARVLRDQFAQAMGAKIVDIAEMDLVLAHLHVPEAV